MIKKKKESKSPETKEESLFSKEKIVTAMKGETSYFAIGLLLVIFGVYLILAFSSFFSPVERTKACWNIQNPEN